MANCGTASRLLTGRRWLAMAAPAIAAVCLAAGCGKQTDEVVSDSAVAGMSPPTGMLADDVVPRHYALHLEIFPEQDRFRGEVAIDVDFARPLDGFWMHGQNLEFSRVVLVQGDRSIPVSFDQKTEYGVAWVSLSAPVDKGAARLEFEYEAPYGAGLVGLYRVDVNDDSYAFTQLESIYARQVFPSFDEPRFKTTWAIAVTTHAGLKALSNMPAVAETTSAGDRKRVQFETTPLLPTYLIAFAVGPLDVVEWESIPPNAVRDRPLPLRGVAVRGQGDKLEFALANTAQMVGIVEAYFQVPFPFAKLDLVAVPEFGWGGMENAGLITYRESALLFEGTPGILDRRGFGSINSHEIAHQWFGDYVTMQWWDDIWLNEAFASWMEATVGREWAPELKFDRVAQINTLSAMNSDELGSARRIRESVDNEDDVINAFDGITYQKGAGVLTMIESWLGADTFREGLRHYMAEYAWSNATVYELMESLTAAAGEDTPVRAVFDSFLRQPGVPLLETRLDCSGDVPAVHVSQSRFLPAGSQATSAAGWNVPVCMAWGDSLNRDTGCFVLEQPAQRFELPADSCPAWLLPNAEGEGYYRWSLPPEGMRALTDVFDDALTARDRISVADSLNASTRAGRMEIEDFLERVPDVLGAVDRQSAILPVDVVEKIVLGLSGDDLARFQAWLRPVLKRRLAAIDAPGGAESDAEAKLFRISLMRLLVMYGNDQDTTQSLASSAGDFLRSAAAGEASVYPDRDLQYLAMMAYGLVAGKDEASLMAEVVTGSEDAGLRADILRGLAVTRDPDAARVAREFVLSGKVLDTQLPTYLFWTLFPLGQPDGWAWVKDSFDQFIDNVPVSSRGVLPNVFFANWLCSDTEARELRALFEPRRASIQGATRALEQADEMISICSAFRKRQLPGVSRFLDQAGI